MRDPNRIYPFCMKLAEEWSKVPDWRFGQLISNCFNGKDPFYIEDEKALEEIEKFMKKVITHNG